MPIQFKGIDNASDKMKKVKDFVENGMGATLDVALDLEERTEGSESAKELQDIMVQYVHMERDMEQWIDAIQQAKTEFTRQYDPAATDVPDIEAIFEEKLEALESANNDKELLKHKRVEEFKKKIWKVHHEGQSMPKDGASSKEDDDADLIMSQATEQTRCPITTKEMVKPMINKKCKHSYEKEAIEYMIKKAQRKRPIKCPISGCTHHVTQDDLEANIELEHYIARKNRKK